MNMTEDIKNQEEDVVIPASKEEAEPVITISKALEICEKKVTEMQSQIDAEHDKYVRAVADYENMKRHSAENLTNARVSSTVALVKDMLPIIDDFERAATHGDLSDGGMLIYNKFKEYLTKHDVHEINPAEGEAFDDNFHNAISVLPVEGKTKGNILDVAMKGYRVGNQVIRYANVVVYA